MAKQLKILVTEQVLDVAPRAGEEIVHAQDLAADLDKPFAEMRAEKARSPRYEYAPLKVHDYPSAR